MGLKKILPVLLLIILVGGGVYYALSLPDQESLVPETPTESPVLTPVVSPETPSDGELIKQALIKKHGWNEEEILVSLNTNDGLYASGGVREIGAEAGGGYWFAAKVGGQWVIVADGNGTISCESLVPYSDFPASLIPECFEEATGKVVKR